MNQMYCQSKTKQLTLFNHVNEEQHIPSKRVNIVSLKLVRESSLLYQNRAIRSPKDGYELIKQYLGDVDREHFVVVSLSTKNTPNSITTCHVGSLNASNVHPREVFKTAIMSNSSSILVAHNHPSSDPTPSQEDCEVTKCLVEAGKILGIDVLDHLIVCPDKFTSLKEKGYI